VIEYDRRPSELAIRSSERLVASSASLHRDGPAGAFFHLLAREVTYLVPEALARDFAAQDLRIRIVEADRGALPVIRPPTDGRQVQEWVRAGAETSV